MEPEHFNRDAHALWQALRGVNDRAVAEAIYSSLVRILLQIPPGWRLAVGGTITAHQRPFIRRHLLRRTGQSIDRVLRTVLWRATTGGGGKEV